MTRWTFLVIFGAVLCFSSAASAEMIHLFARKGDVDKVLGEIDKGVPVDLPSTRNTTEIGVSPLFIAAKFGHADVVRVLVAAGAQVDAFFDDDSAYYPYGTALYVAARWGQGEVVEALLEAGADADYYNIETGSPLHAALEGGHPEIAERLVAAGAIPSVSLPGISDLIRAADPARGKEIAGKCRQCHQMTNLAEDRTWVGPTLWNIVNRQQGSLKGFKYSGALQRASDVWDYDALNSFLAAPLRYLPGTKMQVAGFDSAADRAALIAFLRTLSENPAPLP